jgi:predicted P-loop ATPase
MGAEDTAINRAYSLRWLISIIARAHATVEKPVKVDTMLVLYGGQGIGKSTALQTIALDHIFSCRFFGDSELDMSKYKESVQSIQGKLIYELQELAKRTKDVEIEKAFLTRKIDDVRLPYKRVNEQIPRTTVFIRTANRKNVLTDASGSRRFWCVDLGYKKIKIPELRADIESIWGQKLLCGTILASSGGSQIKRSSRESSLQRIL